MLSYISQLHLFMIIAQACRSYDAECTVGTQPLLSGRQNSSCLAGVNPLARSHSILVQSAAVLFSTAASPAMRQRAATDKGSWHEAPAGPSTSRQRWTRCRAKGKIQISTLEELSLTERRISISNRHVTLLKKSVFSMNSPGDMKK